MRDRRSWRWVTWAAWRERSSGEASGRAGRSSRSLAKVWITSNSACQGLCIPPTPWFYNLGPNAGQRKSTAPNPRRHAPFLVGYKVCGEEFMRESDRLGAVEAILFVASAPVTGQQVADALEGEL